MNTIFNLNSVNYGIWSCPTLLFEDVTKRKNRETAANFQKTVVFVLDAFMHGKFTFHKTINRKNNGIACCIFELQKAYDSVLANNLCMGITNHRNT